MGPTWRPGRELEPATDVVRRRAHCGEQPGGTVADGTAAGSKYPFTRSPKAASPSVPEPPSAWAGTEANAIQMTLDGQTAVIAEYTSGQVQVFTWSGTAWTLRRQSCSPPPQPSPSASRCPMAPGKYVAYVVSDPGTTVNGTVTPITLNGASSAAGTAIVVQHQANPTAAVVTPDGTEVYVANYNSGTVSAINTVTSAVVTIALPGTGPNPIALVTTPDSSHILRRRPQEQLHRRRHHGRHKRTVSDTCDSGCRRTQTTRSRR